MASESISLVYSKPASAWEEALPLGNGHIGAMDFGNPADDLFMLNEKTLWSGHPEDGLNGKCKDAIPLIRRHIDAGEYKEAAELWLNNCQGPYTARYLPMADLHIRMGNEAVVEVLSRQLDISEAVSSVDFTVDGRRCSRKSFISWPDKVMVVRYDSEDNGIFDLDISLSSQLKYRAGCADGTCLYLDGQAPSYIPFFERDTCLIRYEEEYGKGLKFRIDVKVLQDGGRSRMSEDGASLVVEDAASVTILLAAATNYVDFNRCPDYVPENIGNTNAARIAGAIDKGYMTLLERHMADYSELFSRADLRIGTKSPGKVEVEKILCGKPGNEGIIYELLFQYGRYLTIASSREGSLPSNLQGIWNADLVPKWGCNYTTDINLEMNYWLTETTGIPECHKPLLDFIESLSISGEKTAKYNYGIEHGWMVHSNSDAWAQTVPQGGYDRDFEVRAAKWTCWQMAGLWLAQHLWDHYDFNRDMDYLRLYAYPIMKGAAEFALNWMYRDASSGYYVTSPSTSPENRFWYVDRDGKIQYGELCKASTMDMSLIWDCFTNCIEASEVLGIDEAFRALLTERRAGLSPLSVGRHGQLMEWSEDFDEPEVRHRHLSHLFGLYPGRQIVPRRDPELARAVAVSLDRRGDIGPGWDMAWKVCLWSRLEDGDRALEILDQCLSYVEPEESEEVSGLYPNLFMAYPPFQFDANAGVVAGMTEMLLQSHAGEIFVLPALPEKWKDGYVYGLKARGNFEVGIKWKNSELEEVMLKSISGGDCVIRSFSPLASEDAELEEIPDHAPGVYPPQEFIGGDKVEPMVFRKTYTYVLRTEKDKEYNIKHLN